jgi:rod shape-determining protein MreD
MAKKVILSSVFILAAALLQSTVLSRMVVYIRAVPDIALCILVYSAYVNGIMTGQLSGFFSGFLLDFLSASPLGLNAFVRTLIGAFAGFFQDTFYLDVFFLPMALCAGATIFKGGAYFVLHKIFPEAVPAYALGAIVFWIELGMNVLLAPLLFAVLKLFKPLYSGKKDDAR